MLLIWPFLLKQIFRNGLVAVNEQMAWRDFQCANSPAHGFKRGLENIDALNPATPDYAQAPGRGTRTDCRSKNISLSGGEQLGIRKAGQVKA